MTWLPASTLQKNKRQNPKAISLASLNLTTFISTVFFLNCLNLLFFPCLFFVCFMSFLTRSNSAVQKTEKQCTGSSLPLEPSLVPGGSSHQGRQRCYFRCFTSLSDALESPVVCPFPVLFMNILSSPLRDSTR